MASPQTLLPIALAAVLLAACDGELLGEDGAGGADAGARPARIGCDAARPHLPPLVEDREVYRADGLELHPLHVTIVDPDAWDDVNDDEPEARAAIVFSAGAPPPAGAPPNATIRLRGESSRRSAQKSYKIELDGDARWLGQREINLNKHMWDLTRVRNKLSFDLFQTVSHLTSLRTRFVRLFVDGEDHGLYTWIEEADRRFLRAHGLDPAGQLYKAVYFYFQPIEPEVLADPAALDLKVEDKAGADPAKLARMIEAVNDPSTDIDEVIATYFERDNLVTWLAVNILLNNIDTQTHNFYLYSPSTCEGWYFLPWDYDGAWGFYGQLGRADSRERRQAGLAAWWASKLFRRFIQIPANVEAVHARMIELKDAALRDDVVAARLAAYRDVVAPFITAEPDVSHLPLSGAWEADPAGAWTGELDRITSTVSRFYDEYLAVIERPMPVSTRASAGPPPRFSWDAAFDLQGDPVTYDLQISETEDFDDLVEEQTGLVELETTADLAEGTYVWRIIARDGKTADSWQLPFGEYEVLTVD